MNTFSLLWLSWFNDGLWLKPGQSAGHVWNSKACNWIGKNHGHKVNKDNRGSDNFYNEPDCFVLTFKLENNETDFIIPKGLCIIAGGFNHR